DDCGYGAIVRRFEVTDARGLTSTNTCQQVVTVKERHHYKIKFPKDAAANCGIPQADTIEVEELSCDLLAISVKDDFFSASGDECYKIFRTYSVINWCEYDGISDPVVVSRDEDCDGKPGDEDVWVIVETVDDDDPCADYYGNQPAPYYSHVWYDRDGNPFNLNPKAGEKGQNCDYETNPFGFWKEVVPITENETDDTDNYPDGYYGDHCEDMASVGYWQYTQIIKVYDNVNPVVSFTALDPFCSYSNDVDGGCPADVTINFTIDENCTPEDLSITLYLDAYQDGVIDEDITSLLSGVYPNYSLTGSFPLGAHYIGVSVKDGCGNQVGVNIPFEVVDCKAPSPICINGLAVELMPLIPPADADGDGDIDYGAIDIWASDFIASPNSDCSGDVTYSINRIGEDADPDQTGLTLTCDDDASQLIEVWAWDEEGNGDFCETYVLVQDNMINCETASNVGSISGTIANEKSKPIDGVDVELSGNSIQSMETPADGHYIFSDLGRNYDYTVTPFLDAAPLNGVSTFDLVLMSKHILDVQPLSSPYQIIAADVNRSKTITTLDAIQLRRLILNIDTRFTNNTSWRFIPRDFKFQDSKDPWLTSFPEVINVNNLQGDLTDQDFVAIKVGDLNFNALTNALEAQPRTMAGRFLMDVPEQEMKRGEVYRIDFTSSELEQVQGYQFTLLLDPESILLEDLDYGVAEAGNFGLRFVEEGLISTSWNKSGTGKEHFTGDDRLFTLVLRAQKDVRLSEVLRISNRLTIAEAYDVDDQLLEVGINYGTEQVTTAGFELYQNVPNPFRQETSISFYLPTDEQVSIRIYDAGGRTVKMIRGGYGAGYHQLKIDRDELGAAGLMYYTLTAGEYTATRKMVIME
ncbi:MAG: T9SS type A sorting domain-containing protein, partial [Lewinella sp.]|nr:T9SS type A sorting domain-containing protein [Lewinella sp.]